MVRLTLATARGLFVFLVGFLVDTATAQQPGPGDWVVSDTGQTHNGALFFDPAMPAPAPLTTLTVGGAGYINWISMHPNNADLLVNYSYFGLFGVLGVPGGAFTSIVSIPDSPNGQVMDQDGTILVSTSGGDKLWRVDLALKTATVVATLPSTLNNVTLDGDTGEILVAIFDNMKPSLGRVLRLSRSGVILGTLTAGLGQTSSVDFDPISGDFFVTSFDSPEVRRINPRGVATTVALYKGANAVKVDRETGTLLVCGFNRTTRMDVQGKILQGEDHSHKIAGGSFNWTAVEIYGSRKLSGFGSARPGTRYTMNLRFPASPNRGYLVLAGLSGLRPGFKLHDNTGRVVSLNFDGLTQLLLYTGSVPGMLDNFRGVLDARGLPVGGQPVVTLPAVTPKGLRIYLAAAALNPLLASGLDISNPWAFTVQ